MSSAHTPRLDMWAFAPEASVALMPSATSARTSVAFWALRHFPPFEAVGALSVRVEGMPGIVATRSAGPEHVRHRLVAARRGVDFYFFSLRLCCPDPEPPP